MKHIKIKLILAPTLIGAACTAILAFFHVITAPLAEETARRNAVLAAQNVLPEGLPEPVQTNLNNVACFVSFDDDGNLLAIAVEGVTQKGYGGEIRLMAGFTANGIVHNFQILEASGETPGLGSKIKSDKFRNRLVPRPVTASWKLKKDGGKIDAITAATISSRAALEALRDAIAKYKTATGR